MLLWGHCALYLTSGSSIMGAAWKCSFSKCHLLKCFQQRIGHSIWVTDYLYIVTSDTVLTFYFLRNFICDRQNQKCIICHQSALTVISNTNNAILCRLDDLERHNVTKWSHSSQCISKQKHVLHHKEFVVTLWLEAEITNKGKKEMAKI